MTMSPAPVPAPATPRPWHPLPWLGAAALLCVPAIAMCFTPEVNWTGSDFVVFGIMLAAACGGFEFLSRMGGGTAYRIAAAILVLGLFFLVWVNLAVGIIGSEDDDANTMFAAVIATAVGGSIVARFRAAGMVRALLATAAVQAAVGGIAVAGRLGTYLHNWPRDVIVCTAIMLVFWLSSAALFRRAAAM